METQEMETLKSALILFDAIFCVIYVIAFCLLLDRYFKLKNRLRIAEQAKPNDSQVIVNRAWESAALNLSETAEQVARAMQAHEMYRSARALSEAAQRMREAR